MITPIRYVGSKAILARSVVKLFPPHNTYVEVFGGSAAFLFNKKPSNSEIYNDINKDIVTLFRVLQNDDLTIKLQERLNLTMYSREENLKAGAMLEDRTYADDLDHAWATFVKYNQSVNGIGNRKRGTWGYGKTHNTGSYWSRVYAIEKIARRLHNVQIECGDWKIILARYDGPKTLFYLDPPYLPSVRPGGAIYKHEMTPDDHYTLVMKLLEIKGMAILSGYASSYYDDLIENGWVKIEYKMSASMRVSGGKSPKLETIWCSPGIIAETKKPLTLFEL